MDRIVNLEQKYRIEIKHLVVNDACIISKMFVCNLIGELR